MKKFMQKLRDMSVKKRMTISFGIVTFLGALATIVSLGLLVRVGTRFEKALELNGFIQGDIGHYATYLNEERILIRDIVMLQDKQVVEQKKAELAEADEKIAFYFQEMYDKLETTEEKAIVQNMIANLEAYHALRKEIISLDEKGKTVDAFLLLQGEAGDIAHELVEEAEQLLAMNVEMGDNVARNLKLSSYTMMAIIVIALLVMAGLGMTFARYTA